MRRCITGLLAAATLIASTPAFGADGIEDLDGPTSSKKGSKKGSKAKGAQSDIIREIEKGFYLKASIGSTIYLLARGGGVLQPGTATNLSFGQDFLDRERFSVSWEVAFEQALHNGAKFDQLAGQPVNRLIQGDIHSFSGLAIVEISAYPTRRFGIGGRVGGGLMLTPLLIEKTAYDTVVVGQTWGGVRPTVHDSPHPVVLAGPTFEYYTKLSHFSVGADVNAMFAIGLDLGVTAVGYLKYTF